MTAIGKKMGNSIAELNALDIFDFFTLLQIAESKTDGNK